MNYDVVIIGSGLAGLNSALQAAKYGQVLVITKTKILESNSNHAQGGIAAVFKNGDDFKKHIKDTIIAGAQHNNKKAVKYFVKQGPNAIKNLEKIGVHFAKTNNTFSQNREAGHSQNRIVHAGDHTGKSIMEVLAQQIKKYRDGKAVAYRGTPKGSGNITVLENSFAVDLIVKNKTCYGVQILHKGKITNIFARRIILATGGIGQLYQHTTNPKVTTGDGIALAARAGCKMKDLEFIQFHPTAFAKGADTLSSSKTRQSPLFLISETLRGAGAKLLNSKGERFMQKYHAATEMAPRDILARAIFAEQKNGPVYLDIRHTPSIDLKKNFPTIFTHLKKNGYDLSKNLIPVTPAAHYLCGGIATDLKGKTNIKNLFAIGELACTGLHGANRLASNSLLEAAVMSEHVLDSPLPKIAAPIINVKNIHQKILKPSAAQLKKMRTLRQQLQQTMWQNVGIIRTKKGLTKALNHIKNLQQQLPKQDSITKFELQNMLQTSELIVKAALARKKSLGAHFRIN